MVWKVDPTGVEEQGEWTIEDSRKLGRSYVFLVKSRNRPGEQSKSVKWCGFADKELAPNEVLPNEG